ncbi:MAG: Rieske (2Fe-2S) protein [Spirosoma sp.]|nr:Rieske (2Fe-2S) protein [Spirosoma sp.]
MNRHEFFLHAITGISALLFSRSMAGCSDSADQPPAPGLDFMLNLSDQINQSLAVVGGYVITNGVLVAHTSGGEFVAVSAKCTHEGTLLVYKPTENQFYCPLDLSRFSVTGAVVSGPATQPLNRYKVTTLNGANSLRVAG